MANGQLTDEKGTIIDASTKSGMGKGATAIGRAINADKFIEVPESKIKSSVQTPDNYSQGNYPPNSADGKITRALYSGDTIDYKRDVRQNQIVPVRSTGDENIFSDWAKFLKQKVTKENANQAIDNAISGLQNSFKKKLKDKKSEKEIESLKRLIDYIEPAFRLGLGNDFELSNEVFYERLNGIEKDLEEILDTISRKYSIPVEPANQQPKLSEKGEEGLRKADEMFTALIPVFAYAFWGETGSSPTNVSTIVIEGLVQLIDIKTLTNFVRAIKKFKSLLVLGKVTSRETLSKLRAGIGGVYSEVQRFYQEWGVKKKVLTEYDKEVFEKLINNLRQMMEALN